MAAPSQPSFPPPFHTLFHLDLPHGRCVGVALPRRGDDHDAAGQGHDEIPEAVRATLPAEEVRRAETLAPLRRAGWLGGRIALHAALADLADRAGDGDPSGPARAPILSTPRGAPLLPAHVRGSISHKDGIAVALAALRAEPGAGVGVGQDQDQDQDHDDWHLGVDVERVLAGRPDISSHVLRPEEIARLPPPGDPRRAEAIILAFSAKEAIYKALDPFVARHVSFREVAVEARAGGTATVALFLNPQAGIGAGPFDVAVGWLRRDDLILTTARVVRRA